MLGLALLLDASALPGQMPPDGASTPPPCAASQLSLGAADGSGPAANGREAGTELSIRNTGPECVLPALQHIALLYARGRALPITRAVPAGMHPGPAVAPVFLGGGHRAATQLGWNAGQNAARTRQLRVAYVRVSVGGGAIRTPLKALIATLPGQANTFSQPPLRAMEGMAADVTN